MITLYRKNQFGIGRWSIWSEGNTIHIAHSSTLDGSAVTHQEVINQGRQGRTIFEQIQSRIRSRVSKQRDKGYVDSIEEAAKGAFNQLGLIPPMLAQVYKGSVPSGVQAWTQRKLNGLRCLITRQDGQLIAYSRKGKEIKHINEIKGEAGLFVSEGDTIDGELYHHGTSLQTIGSWVKRRQTNTGSLLYAMYDFVSSDVYGERHAQLLDMVNGRGLKRCIVLPKKLYEGEIERANEFASSREKGFEGLMIRLDRSGYESNKRSADLLKDKAKFDTDVICKDIVLSDKGNPVCIVYYEGKEFRVSPPGGQADRLEAYENKMKYLGRQLEIEYRELTDDGIPFHAVATKWRMDNE